ncbi:unnamed protein product [Cyclocybe aegerita]|uniref:Uncharacterized protein n=1 Tax=Cyclocybe aegerita TaxID=1973307 RepID=A0A8S0WV64_CYCAE|nr:unnamed protein product [Cyclocybe aegerita]
MHSPVDYPSSLDTPSSYAARALYGQARGGSQDPLPLLPSWRSSPTPSLNPSTRKLGLESSSQSVHCCDAQPQWDCKPEESSIISAESPAGDAGEVQQRSATLANVIQFLARVLPGKEFRQPASPEEFQAIEKALHGGEIGSNYSSLRLNYFDDHIVIMMPSLTHEIAAGLLQLSMNRNELAADTALSGGCPLVPVVGDQQLSADACFFSSSTPQHGRVAARKTTNALVINLEVDGKPGERVLRSLRVTHWIGKWTPYEAPNEEELQHMKSVMGRVVDEEGNPLNERGAESRNIFFGFEDDPERPGKLVQRSVLPRIDLQVYPTTEGQDLPAIKFEKIYFVRQLDETDDGKAIELTIWPHELVDLAKARIQDENDRWKAGPSGLKRALSEETEPVIRARSEMDRHFDEVAGANLKVVQVARKKQKIGKEERKTRSGK